MLVACVLVVGGCAGSGPRAADVVATAPTPGRWTVTALGDSVTAGSGCDCAPFVDHYAELTHRATGFRVTADNLGVPGQTSEQLLATLTGDTDTTRRVADSDIVIVTIGANDFVPALDDWASGGCDLACFRTVADSVRTEVGAIAQRIRAVRGGFPTAILVTDYWNVFRDGDVAQELGAGYDQISEQVTRLADTAICDGLVDTGAVCVDLYAPFKGDGTGDPTGLLAADGDHPNAVGHLLIAETLAAEGWKLRA
ncbi:lysophospholipase L1-like esterase [Cryptosporangium arvum DSM 44712]|uniref:Lysophospholipase L1-like esterase n=2 Tax=Cryptosporangium TaxID=65502 RepID=A0A011AIS3_9ACTN|nr:lysophospholipase L1-like esterase [Cryptosporangium arvum DSM 44712]